MLNQHKELKAALDKKQEVREILESRPDLTRNDLNELVHTNAQLKDLYDSRPELKELLQQRAKLFEEEQVCVMQQRRSQAEPRSQANSSAAKVLSHTLPLPSSPSTLHPHRNLSRIRSRTLSSPALWSASPRSSPQGGLTFHHPPPPPPSTTSTRSASPRSFSSRRVSLPQSHCRQRWSRRYSSTSRPCARVRPASQQPAAAASLPRITTTTITCTLLTLPSPFTSPPPHYTGTYSVLGMHVPSSLFGQGKGRSVFLFELKLEELLNMQHRREFVLDQGKLKLDVAKTLTFLNERMRF